MSKEKEQRALPFEVERGFNAMPNAVSDFYVRHPKFTPTTERVYRYLLRRYNADYGYAWPSWSVIMRANNIGSRETVQNALDALEHLELIRRFKHENEGSWDNNGYSFRKPIEDEGEFYRKFGDELATKYNTKSADKSEIDDVSDWL